MNKEARHSLLEDLMALLTGTLLVAFAVNLFRHSGLLTGGTPGLTFLAHYASGVSFGVLYFLLNIPFYFLGLRALGKVFTLKTFGAVLMLSLFSELLPAWIRIAFIDPAFSAVLAGLLAGAGMLILMRHHASLGGVGILAVFMQKRHGWSAGKVLMATDVVIVCAAFLITDPTRTALSILGALVMNLVLVINHRPGRYVGQ